VRRRGARADLLDEWCEWFRKTHLEFLYDEGDGRFDKLVSNGG
jgi:hypothetical protein